MKNNQKLAEVKVTPDQVYWMTGDKLPTCGCGTPEDVMLHYLWALGALKWKGAYKLEEMLGSAFVQILFFILEDAGFAEHGYTVFGSWLTESGEQALAGLLKYGITDDELEDARVNADYEPWPYK